MSQSIAMYDFSLECPKFREQLFADFLKCVESRQAVPLSDRGEFYCDTTTGRYLFDSGLPDHFILVLTVFRSK